MAVCSHCGREAAPHQRYCQYCGEALGAPLESAPAAVKVATAVAYGRILVRSTSTSEASGAQSSDEREYVLDGRDVAIGRSPSCDVSLSGDQLASRRHALLRFKNDRYTIVDLGSSNGTYVNDDEIREETTLRDGDFIRIGGHEMLYSTAPAGPGASVAGERLSHPLPHAPLSETNPSVEAIELPRREEPAQPMEDEESAAAEQRESEPGEQPDYVPGVFMGAGDEGPVIALGEAENAAGMSPAPDTGDAAAAAEPVEPVHEEESGDQAGVMDGQSATDELETLRLQLGEISMALAQRAEESARSAERLHAALAEVRDQLRSALDLSFGGAAEDASIESTSELITIARQAAENPRHLDYLSRLAERAGDIADALEARPAAEPDATLRATVEGLIARLDELLP